jgi:hypothetical protein
MNPAFDSPELRAIVKAADPDARIMGRPPRVRAKRPPAKPTIDLTPIGEQYVVPGCERRETARGLAPTQLTLWDATE